MTKGWSRPCPPTANGRYLSADAHRAHACRADKVADDDHVGDVIHGLHEVNYYYRNGKSNELFSRRADRQISTFTYVHF